MPGTPARVSRTRIVATIGPASARADVLADLAREVDVFRLNFSHGSHAGHAEALGLIRAAAEAADRPVAVLADLCGPKIRVGRFPGGGIDLVAGASVTVTTRAVEAGPDLIVSEYQDFARDVRPGSRVLLDDGNLELEVLAVEGAEVRTRVRHGGWLHAHKGINLPGSQVSARSLGKKDLADLAF
ncbi:MAG: hypothetical protein KDA05_00610, partial [Phycisphaerales bacterium]|nr:hypothetical protein [Phycisphaerales bacterium]